jgi:hypothetical protein
MQVQVLRCPEIVKKHVITLVNGVYVGQDVDCSPQEEAAINAEWIANAALPPAPPPQQGTAQLLARINQIEARLNAANIPNPPGPPAAPPGQSIAAQGK